MSVPDVICLGLGTAVIYLTVKSWKDAFKISYYERKLRNRGVDVSPIKNITLWKILRS